MERNTGVVFENILKLGTVVRSDEINRAPTKTQSALLEAMEERQVTADGKTRELPSPFFVIATQNPVEQEGTFLLPEAQVDRFTVKATLGYPSYDGEAELLSRRANREERSPSIEPALSRDRVQAPQRAPETVRVDDDLQTYILDICRATRVDPRVPVGVSPRDTQRLFEAARARAVITGRGYVTLYAVKTIVHPILAHRLVLTADARVNDVQKTAVIDNVLNKAEVPTVD